LFAATAPGPPSIELNGDVIDKLDPTLPYKFDLKKKNSHVNAGKNPGMHGVNIFGTRKPYTRKTEDERPKLKV
jgi:hypothetical protein